MTDELSEREMLRISEYFNTPQGDEPPLAIWIIGRPAAGKTTAGGLLREGLRRLGRHVELVDGEAVRQIFDGALGYSREDRRAALKRLIHINRFLQSRGIIPITATIGGLHDFREMVRRDVANVRFVFLDCPFDVAARRDRKGLYAKALAGEIENFFGVDLIFEPPTQCDITIDSATLSLETIADRVIQHFVQGRFWTPNSANP